MHARYYRKCIEYNFACSLLLSCFEKISSGNMSARFLNGAWQNAQAVYTNVLDLR